jgi:hypothetical protein
MQQLRFVLAVLCAFTLLAFGASQASATQSSIGAPEVCTAQTLADGLNAAGQAKVVVATAFACEGPWAYLWADVTAGSETIGVTVVLKWRPDRSSWWPTDRVVTCVKGVMPELIFRQGCFSN